MLRQMRFQTAVSIFALGLGVFLGCEKKSTPVSNDNASQNEKVRPPGSDSNQETLPGKEHAPAPPESPSNPTDSAPTTTSKDQKPPVSPSTKPREPAKQEGSSQSDAYTFHEEKLVDLAGRDSDLTLVWVSFPAENMKVVDINVPAEAMSFLPTETLELIQNSPDGLTAEALAKSIVVLGDTVVSGGIYFSATRTPAGRIQTDGWTLIGDKQDQTGKRFSKKVDPEKTLQGGWMRVDWKGQVSMVRRKHIEIRDLPPSEEICMKKSDDDSAPECCMTEECGKSYRLMLQSNVILVMDGKVDGFGPGPHPKNFCSALAVMADGRMAIATVFKRSGAYNGTGVTLPEFAQILVDAGAQQALNLDGGPSSQMVYRAKGVSHQAVVGAASPGKMSQLLVVGKF